MFKMNKLITPVKVEINFMHKTKYFSENISSTLEIPLNKSPLHFAIRFMSPAKKLLVWAKAQYVLDFQLPRP